MLNGCLKLVGKNLQELLQAGIQCRFGEFPWIGAISINQNNCLEKCLQVQRTGGVYRRATEVRIWLGNDKHMMGFLDWTCKSKSRMNSILYDIPMDRPSTRLRTDKSN